VNGVATQCSILQKHDNAEATVVQNQRKLNRMKTRYLMMNWLIAVLGMAVVAAGLVAGTTYLDLERKVHADEAFIVTLDRLHVDRQLSTALKTLHDGEVDKAAQCLDLLLCEHILRTDLEQASADAQTQAYVQNVFRKIARVRPKTADGAATGSAQERNEAQAAALRILEQALAGDPSTRTK
jgi:hypothetical protein